MGDLVLSVKLEYFLAIKSGEKAEEYRTNTDYWRIRIEGKTFDRVIIKHGYPEAGDNDRIMSFPWRGYTLKTITHSHFGNIPTEVFAICVGDSEASQ